MAAGELSFSLEDGVAYPVSLTWEDSGGTPIDLTGYTAKLQVRQGYDSLTVLMTKSTANGDIVLGGAAGTIVWTFSAADANTAAGWGFPIFDLLMTANSGQTTRLVAGTISASPAVTR